MNWHGVVMVATATLEDAALFGHADGCCAKDAADLMTVGSRCPTCGGRFKKPTSAQVTEALGTIRSALASSWRVLERWSAFDAAVRRLQNAVEQCDMEAARKLAKEIDEVRQGIGGQP